jgi:glycosyltransferase involved in cell wall biosynthesis
MAATRARREKILMLGHSGEIGGASRSLVTVARELSQAGCTVHVLLPSGPICADLELLGATVERWTPPACYWLGASVYSSGVLKLSPGYLLALALLPLRILVATRMIKRLVRQYRITAIHVNSLVLFPVALPLAVIGRRLRIRVVWHIRELVGDRLMRPIQSLIIKVIDFASDVIVAITESVAEAFLTSDKVVVINNEVDEAWLVREPEPQCLDSQSLIVCTASPFLEGKGIPDFLRMARLVAQRHPDTRFVLYTNRPTSTGRFDRLVWRMLLRLSHTARWVSRGYWEVTECLLDRCINIVFGQEITPDTYSHHSVYVNADEMGVSWGRTVVEAMCAGLPVVTTGCCQEFVIEGQTGFLVPPGRPDLLAHRVEVLLEDADLRVSMGRAGRERAKRLFSSETYRQGILGAFGLATIPRCAEDKEMEIRAT